MSDGASRNADRVEALAPVIVAVATSPGRALRGIIRLSGPATMELLAAHIARSNDRRGPDACDARASGEMLELPARIVLRVRLILPTLRVPALAIIFSTPNSYTGEDGAELQLPGNPPLLERIIDGLLASARARGIDARRAHPGEFTARAFLDGRLSLIQAEGVAATIAAQSDAELRAAHLLTGGALGNLAQRLADELASALALVEAGIDFTDQEDVVAIAPDELSQRLIKLRAHIEGVLDRAVGTEQLSAIPWVALAGAPNAGKSSLFNALLGRERAVVSALAGTTRDVLAEPLALTTDHGPVEVMLVDLAGLDESDRSELNVLMQSGAGAALRRAELILWCVPADGSARGASQGGHRPDEADALDVVTKCDLSAGSVSDSNALQVSAVTREGLGALRAEIARRLGHRTVSLAADALALQPRHDAALRAALANLEEALALLRGRGDRADRGVGRHALTDPELVAAAMRAALDELGALAGTITPDDVLGRVFASFCVGK